MCGQLHAQSSVVGYCLDLFPHVPVNILITNQPSSYNGCQPGPSVGMGKLCSETAEISELFAPLPLSDFRWIGKGHYANDKNYKYIKHANENIQPPIIITRGRLKPPSGKMYSMHNPTKHQERKKDKTFIFFWFPLDLCCSAQQRSGHKYHTPD